MKVTFWGYFNQDTFDHDKEQKSAISGKFLHWILKIFSSVFFFLFLQVFLAI